LREHSQCWVFKRLFFCSDSNLLHIRINMKILHVLRRGTSVFRIRWSIARSYYLWFSHAKKRIDDLNL
jgi:hypothetical protein